MPSTIRATIYLDPSLHRALRLKALETRTSMSDLVNDAVRLALAEDADDLAAVEERKGEPTRSLESFLAELRANGQL